MFFVCHPDAQQRDLLFGVRSSVISAEYCRLLARYNQWMNERLYAIAGDLPDSERKRDRGAFFGSIHRTLNHILWGDRIWLGRFTGTPYTIAARPQFTAMFAFAPPGENTPLKGATNQPATS